MMSDIDAAGDQAAGLFLSLNGWCMVMVYLFYYRYTDRSLTGFGSRKLCVTIAALLRDAGLGCFD
jgi:hypothetical protein